MPPSHPERGTERGQLGQGFHVVGDESWGRQRLRKEPGSRVLEGTSRPRDGHSSGRGRPGKGPFMLKLELDPAS